LELEQPKINVRAFVVPQATESLLDLKAAHPDLPVALDWYYQMSMIE
jgi:hypothetical protein